MDSVLNRPSALPPLPLLLWETPPGLELILAQEGVAVRQGRATRTRWPFRAGRFVLYDGRKVSAATVRARLSARRTSPSTSTRCRRGEAVDPFAALVDNRGGAGGLGGRRPTT